MKYCNICKTNQPITNFYRCSNHKDGLASNCKDCVRKMSRSWWIDNQERGRKKQKVYYEKHREEILASQKGKHRQCTEKDRMRQRERYANRTEQQKQHDLEYQREYQRRNKDKVHAWHKKYREKNKSSLLEYHRRYREEHREEIRRKALERLHNDPKHQMKERTRNMLRYALRSMGHRKNSRTSEILGCDINFFVNYLESTWEKRYGKKWCGEEYHIDHIVPLSTAKTEDDVIRLCHYTNLQMLTPEDNMAKSDRLDWK